MSYCNDYICNTLMSYCNDYTFDVLVIVIMYFLALIFNQQVIGNRNWNFLLENTINDNYVNPYMLSNTVF